MKFVQLWWANSILVILYIRMQVISFNLKGTKNYSVWSFVVLFLFVWFLLSHGCSVIWWSSIFDFLVVVCCKCSMLLVDFHLNHHVDDSRLELLVWFWSISLCLNKIWFDNSSFFVGLFDSFVLHCLSDKLVILDLNSYL